MGRIAAPELEDYPWFPGTLRDAMTGFLRVASDVLGIAEVAAPLVDEGLVRGGTDRVVDLCSGGGGAVLSTLRALSRRGRDVHATLTDLYPNGRAFARAETELPGRVLGRREPTDATAVPVELDGVRTMFNALHHLPPAVAKAVFRDAAEKGRPIATFEVVERSAQGVAIVAGLPLAVPALVPFVRGIDKTALALTYGLPVVTAATTWDGFASCLRAYSVAELRELTADLERPGYRFRIERRRVPLRPVWVTSVFGCPTSLGGSGSLRSRSANGADGDASVVSCSRAPRRRSSRPPVPPRVRRRHHRTAWRREALRGVGRAQAAVGGAVPALAGG